MYVFLNIKYLRHFNTTIKKKWLQEQRSVQNELNKLLRVLNTISNQKLMLEDQILEQFNNQLITDSYCQKMNSNISELKKNNNENVTK